ncbi:MAG: PPC domain-containing DNA-binding protein [Bryobacteraceae bacterium]
MRTTLLFLISLVIAAAQQTRVVTNHSPGDGRQNDPKVPDVYAVDAGRFERVLIFRFKYQADLLAGLEQMVKQNHVRNGVILAAAGSVTGFQVHQVVNGTFPSKIMFEQMADGPADLISMNGYIMNGRLHPHITLATPQHAFGGHLEPGTKVFTFAIVTVGVLPDDLDLSKLDDKDYR